MKFVMISHVIWKLNLSPNAFKLYCICLLFANRATGCFVAKIETIALRGGISQRSVSRGIAELEAVGLLKKENRFINREHYIASKYTVARFQGNFTCVPVEAVTMPITAHAFVIYSYLLKCSNKVKKAFPSIRGAARTIEQSTTTIQKHLKAFHHMKIIRKEPVIKRNGSNGHNQYVIGALFFILAFITLGKKREQTAKLSALPLNSR